MMEGSERQVARLSMLVSDLLDASRLGAGPRALRRESIDLAQLTREIVELFGPEFARARCEVRLEASAPVVGSWDRARLERLVTHLLTHALTYGEGHPVEVAVASDDDAARLSVRDHGPGTAIEDPKRFFERAPARDAAGRGLGLFIAQQVVQAHDGTITVESEPGAGFTLSVVLPRGMPGAAAAHP
jgi:signal transduction histidine kinase